MPEDLIMRLRRALKKKKPSASMLAMSPVCSQVFSSACFFFFKARLKRMIKSSGMNVYPAQVEDILCKHPDVDQACVIGVPDKAQVEMVKGFVVLKDKSKGTADMEKQLISHCRENLIKWSCPREIEFRDELPLTLIGKVDFKVLAQEEIDKLKAAGQYTGE